MTEKYGPLYNLALFKQRYTRGTSWTQIALNFGIITANAKLFEDFFSLHLGMTLPMVIALSVPCYIIVCYIIGHYDERSGFWQMENNQLPVHPVLGGDADQYPRDQKTARPC